MKTMILKLFALACCISIVQSASAQEDKAVTAKLKEKYAFVYLNNDDGGWYKISSSVEYGCKACEGACDLKGKEIIPPIYDNVDYEGDHYKVELNGKVAIKDLKNRELFPFKYEDIEWSEIKEYGYCRVELNGKVGIIDKKGKEIVAPKYDGIDISDFEGGEYAMVELNDKEGFVDKQGKEILTPKYDNIDIYNFKDTEYAIVTLNGKEGVVNKQGREIVAPKYDDIDINDFKDTEYATVTLNDKKGLVDKQGREIVAPKYERIDISDFEDNEYAGVNLNGKWGLIDKQGKEIIVPKYAGVDPYGFQDYEYTTICMQNGEEDFEGVVDKQGNEIIPCEYTYISIVEKNKAIVLKGGKIVKNRYISSNGKWGMYDLFQKKWLAECKYDYLGFFSEGLTAFNIGGKKLSDVKKGDISGGKWGYIDMATGKEIITAQYETVEAFKDGAAMVSMNGKTTLIENPLAKGSANIDPQIAGFLPDVDANIPISSTQNTETFAFIFANEDYPAFRVPFAHNDGKIFKEYCLKTLGVPEKNIRFYENATIGNMTSAINRIKDIDDALGSDARFVIYYSGQGATDENTRTPYLLPVDASLNDLATTAYSVDKLNGELSGLSSKSILLILDACFNGKDRDGKMLISARSAVIKAKPIVATGNMLVFSAATEDETAYSYKEKNHGLFTYYLLKKLQETKGDITCKALADYVVSEVKKQSLFYTKIQSPAVAVSNKLTDWQTLKFK